MPLINILIAGMIVMPLCILIAIGIGYLLSRIDS